MEIERVLGAFSLLADIEEQEARNNLPVVQLAIDEVEAYIGDGDFTGDERDKLHHAAAACAYYKYVVLLSTREGMEVSVSDIQFSAADLTMAKALRDDALEALSTLAPNKQFAFRVIE